MRWNDGGGCAVGATRRIQLRQRGNAGAVRLTGAAKTREETIDEPTQPYFADIVKTSEAKHRR